MNVLKFSRLALLLSALAIGGSASAAPARTYATKGSFTSTVVHGNYITIGPFSSLNSDCSAAFFARIRLVSSPRKGRISYSMGRGEPGFERNDPFAKCNDVPQNGPMIEYRPKPGAFGPDRFQFLLQFQDGERRTVDVNLEIK